MKHADMCAENFLDGSKTAENAVSIMNTANSPPSAGHYFNSSSLSTCPPTWNRRLLLIGIHFEMVPSRLP